MRKNPFTDAIIQSFYEGKLDRHTHQQVLDWLSTLPAATQEEFLNAHLHHLEQQKLQTVPTRLQLDFDQLRDKLEENKLKRRSILLWPLKVAAALAPIILAYVLFYQPKTQPLAEKQEVTAALRLLHENNNSQQRKVLLLPDSSRIILYPGAKLTYPAVFAKAKREVELRGKAFFDIRHAASHPFTVHTGKLETVVLGTSFWVDATGNTDEIHVAVKTGKVGVRNAGHTVFLLPAEEAVFAQASGRLWKKTKQQLLHTLPHNPALPASSAIAFNQTPLPSVLKALEEQFHKTIILKSDYPAGAAITLSTKGKSLENILKEINAQTPIQYEIKAN